MNQLIDVRDNINLWWTQGFSSSQIHYNLSKLDDETWIMDGIEIQIDKLWALKYPGSLDKQCLLIKKPMLRFGIYEERKMILWKKQHGLGIDTSQTLSTTMGLLILMRKACY